MIKKWVETILYKTINKVSNAYWRVKKREDKLKFAVCGDNITIGNNCSFSHGNIHLGDNVFIGEYASFISSISKIYIGSNVMFGPHVTIRGGDHRTDLLGKYMIEVKESEKKPENDKDVYIEDDTWIGSNVTILKGVRIGTGSVVGACSVVTKDIPPYTIHVGCAGIKEKPRFNDDRIIIHNKLINERKIKNV